MCGIAGICNFQGIPLQKDQIQAMITTLNHRGPDDEGIFLSGSISPNSRAQAGLGHKRLSIIDLKTGHQPMSNEDGTVWIVHNGEVYNFPDLRNELIQKGHRFRTHSDTETIIHLYEEMGTSCVNRLRGMFAFAIWDTRKERLFIARDRVGKKPVNYFYDGKTFYFGSEIKAILACGIKKEPDPASLHRYLTYGYTPSPDTMFKDVKKLPPAHILIYDKNGVKTERFWKLSYTPKKKMSFSECEERIEDLISECVRIRLRSDVPLGVFLSGGVDSSTVAAFMSEATTTPIKTFTIGFQDADFSEVKFARQVAERLGTEHHEFTVKPEALKILPKLVWHYNEPYGDSSCIPTYYVSKMTRDHVTVALCGDGGDESFAGYERYKGVKLSPFFEKLPRGLLKVSADSVGLLSKLSPKKSYQDYIRYASNFLMGIYKNPRLSDRYLGWMDFVKEDQKKELYTKEMKGLTSQITPVDFLSRKIEESDAKSLVEKIMSAEITSYLSEDLLVKVDIATMANSLEARSPFLDHNLMEFMATVPLEYKLRGLNAKYILKKIASKKLPSGLLNRKKMGFGVPIGRWFRNEMKSFLYEIMLEKKSLKRGYFNPDYIKKLLDEHTSGKADHKNAIWALLNFEIWHRIFIEGESL